MVNLPRDVRWSGNRSVQLVWFGSLLGSYYIAKYLVSTKYYDVIFAKLGLQVQSNSNERRLNLILGCVGVRALRQLLWISKFIHTDMDVPTAIVICTFNFALDLMVLLGAARNPKKTPEGQLEVSDYIGLGLFAAGSILETGYDYELDVFKKKSSQSRKTFFGWSIWFDCCAPELFGICNVESWNELFEWSMVDFDRSNRACF